MATTFVIIDFNTGVGMKAALQFRLEFPCSIFCSDGSDVYEHACCSDGLLRVTFTVKSTPGGK
jgi:hypothetical protein